MHDSVWQLGGLSLGRLGARVWRELSADDVFNRAAALAYYFLLALFPALLFLVSLLGWVAEAGTGLRADLLNTLAAVMPTSALQLVSKTLDEISAGAGGGKLSIGLLLALWAASNGVVAIIAALNAAYKVTETRPWYRVRLISVALTLAISLLVICSLVLVLFGGHIAQLLQSHMALGGLFLVGWNIARWLVVAFFVSMAFALTYYFGPSVKEQRWYWITPGSALGLSLWLAVSLAFRLYLSYFDRYQATYGSLGAVIVLMLWFYMSGLAFLVGGEVNAEIEAAAAEHGRADAKIKGTKKPGELPPIAPHVPSCVTRPAPSLRQIWSSARGLMGAVKRFIGVLKEHEEQRQIR